MKIRVAGPADQETLARQDRHVSRRELDTLTGQGRVYMAETKGQFAGWLRFGLFWDNTPFLNMLFVLEPYRGRGVGRALVRHWEERMKAEGYPVVMTSTVSDECAQHFFTGWGIRRSAGLRPAANRMS